MYLISAPSLRTMCMLFIHAHNIRYWDVGLPESLRYFIKKRILSCVIEIRNQKSEDVRYGNVPFQDEHT